MNLAPFWEVYVKKIRKIWDLKIRAEPDFYGELDFDTKSWKFRKKRYQKFLMMKILQLVIKMVTKLVKKNKFAQELFTKKYKPRVIKPKKGKGSFKRKKK